MLNLFSKKKNMNEKQLAKLYYLKRLLNIYVRFLSGYDRFGLEYDDTTSMVKVKFYKTVDVVLSNGNPAVADNTSESVFYISNIGRVIAVYKFKLKTKFKNRHSWNG